MGKARSVVPKTTRPLVGPLLCGTEAFRRPIVGQVLKDVDGVVEDEQGAVLTEWSGYLIS
jgi:hypothetical protein